MQDVDWFVTAPDWPKSGSQVVAGIVGECVYSSTRLCRGSVDVRVSSYSQFTHAVGGTLCILQTWYSIIHNAGGVERTLLRSSLLPASLRAEEAT